VRWSIACAFFAIASYVAYDLVTSPWPWTATLKHIIEAPNLDDPLGRFGAPRKEATPRGGCVPLRL
jgi:hypothetical protein